MIDFGKITFSREYDNGESVTHSISGESSLSEVLEAFEYFLKGCAYFIPEGESLDFVPEHSFDDTHRGHNPQESFDEYGNYGENNPPVAEPTAEKGYPSYEAVNRDYRDVKITYNGEPVYTGPWAK